MQSSLHVAIVPAAKPKHDRCCHDHSGYSLMSAVRTGRFPARPLRPDWQATGSDEETSDDEVSAESAGEIFSSYVLDLLYKGKISAKDACLVFYWAHLSGAPDRVGQLGFPPNKPSGHYQRHLDCVLQTKMHGEWYTVQVPGHNKHDQSRCVRPTPVLLPYDEVVEEVITSPAFASDLSAKVSSGDLPDAFYDHPNRNRHVDGIMDVPIGLFVDAVPTVKRDSCIGFFLFNIITQTRFLIAVLRKRCLCHCGCRGWCSYFAIWDYLRWALTAFAVGYYPLQKHDGTAWGPGRDADRAGQRMPCRGLTIQLKADWAEWGSSLGFASHATNLYPCVCCFASQEDWHHMDDVAYGRLPWCPTCSDDYRDACALCEIHVTLTCRQDHAAVRRLLRFDRRPDGGRGRCLSEPLPGLHLERGDRLEPSSSCPDIGVGFDDLANGPFPVEICFWRRSKETSVRHRCPIMDVPGCTPSSLMIDTLHCIFLGVVPRFLEAGIWLCIVNNVWRISAAHTATRDQLCIQRCRAELFQWYRRRASTHGERVTELSDLTQGMLGTRGSWSFSPKGAEARWMLPFVNELLVKHRASLPAAVVTAMIGSGSALERLIVTMYNFPAKPSHEQCKASWGTKGAEIPTQRALAWRWPRTGNLGHAFVFAQL